MITPEHEASVLLPWPEDPRYLIGSDGSVIGPDGRFLRGYLGTHGRRVISVSEGRKVLVSWMVCETFHGPRPDGAQAAHEDGDRLNDRADNLAWKTPRENSLDRLRHGTMRNKLTEQDVHEIRAFYAAGTWKLREIASMFGVTKQTIWHIAHKKTWSQIS